VPPRAKKVDRREMGAIRQRAPDEVLQADRRRQEAALRRTIEVGTTNPGHRAHPYPRDAVMFERLKWLLTRRTRESTMNDELEAHIACETDDQIARGLDPTAAREAALRAFGNR